MNNYTKPMPRPTLLAPRGLLRYVEFAAILLGAVGLLTSRATAGPLSTLYMTSGVSGTGTGEAPSRLTAIRGSRLIFGEVQFHGQESAIAVNDTVSTLGVSSGVFFPQLGSNYRLDGFENTTINYPFPAALGSDFVYDGTTDGRFNYFWDLTSGAAYKSNLGWSGATLLFTLGNASGHRLGITYDASNNSLWLSGYDGAVGTLISDYSLNGTLLSSFNISHIENGFLALDPADGTLWLDPIDVTGNGLILEQYARSAAGSFGATQPLLQAQGYIGLPVDALGGEFQYTGTVVPEPSTGAILGFGALALLGFRRLSPPLGRLPFR